MICSRGRFDLEADSCPPLSWLSRVMSTEVSTSYMDRAFLGLEASCQDDNGIGARFVLAAGIRTIQSRFMIVDDPAQIAVPSARR